MSAAYIYFIERDVVFTPSAVLDKGEHVTIKMVSTRPLLRRRQRNSDSGRYEIAVHIPVNYGEKFWMFVYIDKHPRQKWRNWFALEIEVDGGVITDVMTYMNRCPEDLNPSGVTVKYPSGEYATSEYEWHKYPMSRPANSAFVWLP